MGGMAAAMQDNATSITSGERILMQSSFAILMIKFFINWNSQAFYLFIYLFMEHKEAEYWPSGC